MERQKATTEIKYNDSFSHALIESASRFLGEQGIPTLKDNPHAVEKPLDDFSKKDPKEKAEPATQQKSKYSLGAQIKDTTKVAVTQESCGSEHESGEKKKCSDCGKSPCECEDDEKESGEKKEKMKEVFNVFVDDVHYVFEKKNEEGKEQGLDGKACWKGYKRMGTKEKGGKTVDNCVKAGYEAIGDLMLDEKAPPGDKYERMVKHIKKGYSEGGVSEKEKSIAYATAWKEKNKAKKESYDVDTANQLWSEVAEKLEKLGKMDGAKFKVIGEKMDPVGKEDKDIDNDGDHDKSDKYLHARRKKIGKILAAKKKIKEGLEISEKKN